MKPRAIKGRVAAAALLVGCTSLGCGREQGSLQEPPSESLAGYVLDQPPREIGHRLYANFAGKVQLLGFDMEPAEGAGPGDTVKLTLYWRSSSRLGPGWGLFTHLLDAAGRTVANYDEKGPLREPNGEAGQVLGPGHWQPGKVYVDTLDITLPGEVTGQTSLVVGLWQGGSRLGLVGGSSAGSNQALIAHFGPSGPLSGARVVARLTEAEATPETPTDPTPPAAPAAPQAGHWPAPSSTDRH